MSEALQGYKGKVRHSTSSTGGAITTIGEIRDFTLLLEASEIDVTSHQSSGDEEVIIGKVAWSATADALHIQGNASQQALIDCLINRTAMEFQFLPTGESTDGYLTGTGYVDEWEMGSPLEDAMAVSLGIVGTETLGFYAGYFYPSVSSGLMVLQTTDTDLRFAISSGLALVSSSGTYVAVINQLNGLMYLDTTQ